ncbi:hypothetical protein, partial [Chitinilyticum piscinae]|uniref:hypothetical protein n=1 Tax=Chitinilyticum piscinae TaxID=2866724 RepID=UPI001D1648E3
FKVAGEEYDNKTLMRLLLTAICDGTPTANCSKRPRVEHILTREHIFNLQTTTSSMQLLTPIPTNNGLAS